VYVDVIVCKRSRVKVDVTLAKRSANRIVPAEQTVVSIPARVAVSQPAEEPETDFAADIAGAVEDIAEGMAESDTEEVDEGTAETSETTESSEEEAVTMSQLLEMTGDGGYPAESDGFDVEDAVADECPDEESLAAIEAMLGDSDDTASDDDMEDITDEQIEEYVAGMMHDIEDMSRWADGVMERIDSQLAEALEELDDETEEDAERLSSAIEKELESLDGLRPQKEDAPQQPTDTAGSAAEAASEECAPQPAESSYMRYFDRDEQGDMVELTSESGATGQSVVCYDEQSGKLSRVCGIIKNTPDKTEENPE